MKYMLVELHLGFHTVLVVVMKVLLFGPARDAMDCSVIDVHLTTPISVLALRHAIDSKFPDLRTVLKKSIFALNNKLVPRVAEDATNISEESAELVLVPPVSGG